MLSFAKQVLRRQRFISSHIENIYRKNAFTSNEHRTQYEQNYMRKVLQKTSGCILYQPDKHLEDIIPLDTFSEKNEIVAIIIDAIDHLKKSDQLSLDEKCLENYKAWSINEQLLVLDACFSLKHVKYLSFFHVALGDFLQNFAELTNGPALQTMYYIASLKRKFNPSEESIVIDKLEKIVTKLTLDEVAIYCLALAKNEFNVKNSDLVKSLYDCLINTDLHCHDEIGVTGILKALRRFSTSTNHLSEMKELQKKLVPFVKSANMQTLTHTIQLGCKQRIFTEELINVIIERFSNNLDKLRIKDVERALLSISTFNQRSENTAEMIFINNAQTSLLKSLDTKFPASIIRCVSYLAILGVADERLVDWALNTNTHSFIYKGATPADEHHLLIIDAYAKINLAATYKGHTLPDDLCAELMPKVVKNKTSKISAEIAHEMSNLFMTNQVHCILSRPLPYDAFPDILFVYNKSTRRTMTSIRGNADGRILAASDLHKKGPDIEAVAIVPCFQRQTIESSYTGLYKFKLDQLKTLGFKVIVIKDSVWNYYSTSAAKRKYLAMELYRNNILLLNNTYRFDLKTGI